MPKWTLRIRSGKRDLALLPQADDALGQSVLGRLQETASKQGPPRAAVLAVHGDRIEQFDLAAVNEVPEVHRGRLLASIAGRQELECGMLAGTMRVSRSGGRQVRGLVVFIEWPDNRWWTAWQPLNEQGKPDEGHEPVIRRAVDGWPRPRGVGGWFSRVRREGLRLRVNLPTPVAQPGVDLVH